VWSVPAERMKGRKGGKKPFATALPKQAIAILEQRKAQAGVRNAECISNGRVDKITSPQTLP
jgi:hypothetical protein